VSEKHTQTAKRRTKNRGPYSWQIWIPAVVPLRDRSECTGKHEAI